jgi:hypothetical protein
MSKQSTILEIQEKINKLNINISESLKEIKQLEEINSADRDNNTVYLRLERIYKENKNIERYNFNIQKLEYQILVGGRKLKTNIAISKELVNAGFFKQRYIAGVCGEGGCSVGDFKVKDMPTEIIISHNKYIAEKLSNYLIKKYVGDVIIENYRIIIKK